MIIKYCLLLPVAILFMVEAQAWPSGSLATRTVLGQPIGHFYGYKIAGVFQTDAEAAPWGAKAGDFRFEDISGPAGRARWCN